MMELFLTSVLGGMEPDAVGGWRACGFSNENGLGDMIMARVKKGTQCLMIASDPDNYAENDYYHEMTQMGLSMSGFDGSGIVFCDHRNSDELDSLIAQSGFIILAGGHVPTQNRFFEEIDLKGKLRGFDGVVAGISAGTMNCASVVYAQPELDGEAVSESYQRYIPGLGLTGINVLPHFQYLRTLYLDGLRVLEDICLPDSKVRPFYALNDGSFIHCAGGKSTLYGDAYLFSDGSFRKICSKGESIEL